MVEGLRPSPEDMGDVEQINGEKSRENQMTERLTSEGLGMYQSVRDELLKSIQGMGNEFVAVVREREKNGIIKIDRSEIDNVEEIRKAAVGAAIDINIHGVQGEVIFKAMDARDAYYKAAINFAEKNSGPTQTS